MNEPSKESSTVSVQSLSHPHEFLWRRWGRKVDWQNKVEEQVVRKALDIPSDDMNLNVDKSTHNQGLSSLATLGLAAGAAIMGGGIPAALLFSSLLGPSSGLSDSPSQSLPVPPPAAVSDSKSDSDTTKSESSESRTVEIKETDAVIKFFREDAETGELVPIDIERAPAPVP